MLHAVDHVVLGARDGGAVCAAYASLFGRAPSWRAQSEGVRSFTFALSNVCLEILAPCGPGPRAERLEAALEKSGEGIMSLVFATRDIAAAHRRFTRLGLAPSDVAFSESADEGGGVRRMKSFRLSDQASHGVRLFVAEREQALPLSESIEAAPVTGMDHIVVSTPAPDRAAALYGARLGLELTLDRTNPDWGSRLMFFRCHDMIVEVAHSLRAGVGDGADKFYGMTWRVDDAEAAHRRISGAGFSVSEVRNGRKPGTKVFTVRDKTGGAPTLILQPSPERKD